MHSIIIILCFIIVLDKRLGKFPVQHSKRMNCESAASSSHETLPKPFKNFTLTYNYQTKREPKDIKDKPMLGEKWTRNSQTSQHSLANAASQLSKVQRNIVTHEKGSSVSAIESHICKRFDNEEAEFKHVDEEERKLDDGKSVDSLTLCPNIVHQVLQRRV